jgi:cytochrome P450
MTTLAKLDSDPYPTYARLRAVEPVAWLPEAGQWLVTGWHDVLSVLSDPERFAGDHIDVHAVFRAAYDHDQVAEQIDAITRPVARKAADDIFSVGRADLAAEYFEPVAAVAEATLLGVGAAGADPLRRWGHALALRTNNFGRIPAIDSGAIAAMAEDTAIKAVVERLRERPDDSVVATMVAAGADVLSVLKQLAIGVLLPGWLAGWTLVALWSDREQLAAVTANRGLLGAAVYEALRWSAPVGVVSRRATQAMLLGGKEIAEGDRLTLALASANRDGAVFDDPDRFDVHRPLRPHLGFGAGPHHCPAHPLVTAVAATALDELFERIPDVRPALGWRHVARGWRLRTPGRIVAEWDGGRQR